MANGASEVLVGRRLLERGFLDEALRLFTRNPGAVRAGDWLRLSEGLLARSRVADAVSVCELGSVPLPREAILAQGDAQLARKSVDAAIRTYELGGAGPERWDRVVDVLTSLPHRARQAIELAERHLVPAVAREGGPRLVVHHGEARVA